MAPLTTDVMPTRGPDACGGPALFTLYGDRRLQQPDTIAELVRLFGLTGEQHAVRSDAHYRTLA